MGGEIGMFTSCRNVFLEDPPEAHQTLQLLLFFNCWCFRFLLWNADDAQLAISAATSNVRLLCTKMYGFVPLAERITVGPLLSPFAEMCQVKRNLHPHHGGTLVCSGIVSMIMQRVIFRSLPIFQF